MTREGCIEKGTYFCIQAIIDRTLSFRHVRLRMTYVIYNLKIMSTTLLGQERLKMLRCALHFHQFCSQTCCRMILFGCKESKQPVSVSENVSDSQLETGRSSTSPVENKNSPEIPKFPTKSSAFQAPHEIKNATSIIIRKVKHITQLQVQFFIRQTLSIWLTQSPQSNFGFWILI